MQGRRRGETSMHSAGVERASQTTARCGLYCTLRPEKTMCFAIYLFCLEITKNLCFVAHISLYLNLCYNPLALFFLQLCSRFLWIFSLMFLGLKWFTPPLRINPLNTELNPICHLLALLGVHHFLHVSRIRVKSLTLKLLMSYIYIWSTYSWCF